MERLTKRAEGGIVYNGICIICSDYCSDCSRGTADCRWLQAMIEKLAEYEDLEEQSLLLRLPCKVGDIVYEIRKYSYCSSGICRSEKSCSECRENAPYKVHKKKFKIYDLKELGKTVFLTQEEAEEALQEREAQG